MTPANPYEPPQTTLSKKPIHIAEFAPGEGWLEPVRSNLLRVARYHRGMTCFGLLLLAMIVGILLIRKFGGEVSLIGIILLVALGIVTIFFTCGLSLAIQAKERPLVVAVGMLIPPAAIMLLLQYSVKASQYLQSNGIKIGLLGVKRKDILMQLGALQARHENALLPAEIQNS